MLLQQVRHSGKRVFQSIGACVLWGLPLALSVAAALPRAVTAERLDHADEDTANWLSHGRTYSEQRFSPLRQISASTVSKLGLAWYADLDTDRGQESTPLEVDGVLYVTSAWSRAYAIEASTGKRLWSFDPKVPGETAVKACCDLVNRGVAFWNGRLYLGTLDGRLIALDAKSGKAVWSQVTVDQSKPYTITGAPRIVKGKVLIGNGGAEYMVRGYVSAYDADSGALAWRFYTVPGDPSRPQENPILESAKKTWSGEWFKFGGGGTVWDSMAYDPELDLLYIGVGNGGPWNQAIRSPAGGDNLFLSSIVALRPETGEYVWHYQTTPGDQWDYTATQHIVLADLEIGGQPRKVLLQAPKNGFFYVLDRTSGKLISAQPYAAINWATGVDPQTGRPIMNPAANYGRTGQPWLAMPGPLGAHSWHPMSFSPETGLVYLPSFELGFAYTGDKDFSVHKLAVNLGLDGASLHLPADAKVRAEIVKSVCGHLIAWDPVRQQKVWDVQHPAAWNGGVLSTAGDLVFQGDAAGEFAAYNARNGHRLWTFETQQGIVAPPISFEVQGEQYVAVVVGWGGAYALITGEIAHKASRPGGRGRLLAFKLGGSGGLPAPVTSTVAFPKPPPQFADAAQLAQGEHLFYTYCVACHGPRVVSGGVVPDLRKSAATARESAWAAIVRQGALKDHGMVAFASVLSDPQAEAIRGYVIQRATEDYTTSGGMQ
jgi:alcohol dehydrogenase (cytochrome c)/quinohemoprotein ethanol dehydrogenase